MKTDEDRFEQSVLSASFSSFLHYFSGNFVYTRLQIQMFASRTRRKYQSQNKVVLLQRAKTLWTVLVSRLTLFFKHYFNAEISYRVWFKLDYKNKIFVYPSVFLPPPSIYPFLSLISGGRANG